ncbi:hypothetical protein [Actinospongicola halichondriae]|uniref:hypothetical protein n=1 Tax=Actinospongicola halichondriae TaxID=3236844 RepID=UPI003D417118
MTTTEPQATNWTEALTPLELRREADEIRTGLSELENKLIEYVTRAQRFAAGASDFRRKAEGDYHRMMEEHDELAESDISDGINALVFSLSGYNALYGTLLRINDISHPDVALVATTGTEEGER